MLFKKHKLIIFLLAIFGLGIFVLVQAQEEPPPICGNGIPEAGEDCDDGNHDLTDDCDTYGETPNTRGQCTNTFCGDGQVQIPNGETIEERCDTAGKGYCTNNPSLECNNDAECGGGSERCIFSCTAECGTELLGWGWSENFGWLSLNRDNCEHLDPTVIESCEGPDIDYYVQVDTENNLKGWAWSENIGWICFGDNCNGLGSDYGTAVPANNPGPPAPAGWWAQVQDDGTEIPPIKGWGKILLNGDEGWFSLNCENDGNGCIYPYQVQLGSEFYPPHGDEDNKVFWKTLFGWAWNNSDIMSGLGWLRFTPEVTAPWLETRLGDIYAKEGIKTPRPIGKFNATYRILAYGGIEALSARGEAGPWIDPDYGPIDFPTPLTRYSNILGKLDVAGLVCEFVDDFGAPTDECINKYGKKVIKITEPSDLDFDNPLNSQIYYIDFDLVINNPVQIKNASGFNNGAGTIIVNSDLRIDADITYEPTGGLDKFRNLASVSWIVKGDVTVDPSVQNLVGAFIVLGDGGEGSGVFSSGVSANSFTISGLVMAREFNFERTGGTGEIGSEVIIYDGRLLANIPPGLENFVSALPIWREGIFSQ